MNAYYNENDPFAAEWLRGLIRAGLITPGFVDERSIEDVQPGDLAGYDRCHFFAGIGGWDYALQLAGWDGPVWTGSCPCQPFSAAGKGGGFNDSRHLWPTWFRLIRECRPPAVFGEQVASKAGLGWFDLVSTDLEGEGYSVGAADLCAASVGAPHIRQRLWFVAHDESEGRSGQSGNGGGQFRKQPTANSSMGHSLHERLEGQQQGGAAEGTVVGTRGGVRGLAHSSDPERRALHVHREDGRDGENEGRPEAHGDSGARGQIRGVAFPDKQRRKAGKPAHGGNGYPLGTQARQSAGGSGIGGLWSDVVWLPCRDGKARPTQSGIFPLAHGIPNRVGTLRGAGNAIVPQVAAEFIAAYREAVAT